jgi:repressor LexA
MDVSSRLRMLCKDAGMTQQDIADKLDVTRVSVGKWESGIATPRPKNLEDLAALFGTSVSYLLGEDGPERVESRATSAMVPMRAIGVTCMGDGDEQDADAVVEVPEGVAARHPGLFVVHGIGSCMDRRFPEDAALGVDPDMEPRTGDAVLVRDEAHGSFVHVYMAGSGGTVMLSADSWSETYEDLVVGPEDPPVEVLGTVVWWQAYEDVTR